MSVLPSDLTTSIEYKGHTHSKCEWFPCHNLKDFANPSEFNCLFCYCPLARLECPGIYDVITDVGGTKRKDCSQCTIPHDGYDKSWKVMNLSRYQKQPKPWSGK